MNKPAPTPSASRQPLPGFAYSRDYFEHVVDVALAHARKLGASDAGAEISQ
jgi:PmbA protein